MEIQSRSTTCCIVGGGPAGMMLGYLLARAGIDVTVLEKHKDFFRDFRGDTIHPSTLQNLRELGLLDEFLKLPHEKTKQLEGDIGTDKFILADFSKLKTLSPYIVFMPQWDFLNFLKEKASHFPTFHLLMEAEGTELLKEDSQVAGVKVQGKEGKFDIKASLVVGADGRHSLIRKESGLKVKKIGVPIDVLWFRISRKRDDPKMTLGRVDNGHMMVMIERGDYWQCGYVIPKGKSEEIKEKGIDTFRDRLTKLEPIFNERVAELDSWEKIKLLSVSVDRLEKWFRSGLLCIGDSAHAMSPVGGVGINLAIQDAIAAANILTPKLLEGGLTEEDLQQVQKRREFPTEVTQKVQVFIQDKLIRTVLKDTHHTQLPLFFKIFKAFPYLRRFPARFVGIGVRPEHISPYLQTLYHS